MFAQLFLGIYFIVLGLVEHFSRKPNWFLSEGRLQSLPKDQLPSYLRKVGTVHIIFGLFIASMGQIEYWYNPDLRIFISIYIIIGFACLATISYLNKKYSGSYLLRL